MKILVTGGCGYIGSHTIVDLIENGFDVISIDNYINSTPDVLEGVEKITGRNVINYNVNLCDKEKTRNVFLENPDIIGIIHFAALKSIPDSVSNPLLYYNNNIVGLINILDIINEFNIKHFIFSSSCSVYGEVESSPVDENTKLNDTKNPYSTSKKMSENIISDYYKVNKDKNCVILRYFNPGGSHESGIIGENITEKSSNIIPVLLKTIENDSEFLVYGGDYPTRDGTCIRDYIYIMDIANAHTKSIELSIKNKLSLEVFNVGSGTGTTVIEAIKALELVSGYKVRYTIVDRRDGDISSVYADYKKALDILNWKPTKDINHIMKTSLIYKNYLK